MDWTKHPFGSVTKRRRVKGWVRSWGERESLRFLGEHNIINL